MTCSHGIEPPRLCGFCWDEETERIALEDFQAANRPQRKSVKAVVVTPEVSASIIKWAKRRSKTR